MSSAVERGRADPEAAPVGGAGAYVPVVIVGAARSGTNMLRDVLTRLPGLGTWPCDEINYIWRYGNARHPTDELTPDLVTEANRRYIRRAFAKMARRTGSRYVVEKTCANTLRVPFVHAIVPEAKYLSIQRDGLDVVHSAMVRWRARPALGYLLRKARYVPLRGVPYYGLRFVRNQLHRVRSGEGHLSTWGPRFEGIDELVARADLATVCATQWRESVEAADAGLATITPDRVHRLRYEQFVVDPVAGLREIVAFLGAGPYSTPVLEAAVADVSAASVGRGRARLSEGDRRRALGALSGTLNRLGYDG